MEKDPPGFSYFCLAWNMLPSSVIQTDILAAQCQLLASAYLCYIFRPMEAWNLMSNASMKVQLLLSSQAEQPPALKELITRVYWNCFLFESELMSKLRLPQSGIQDHEYAVALPTSFKDESHESIGPDELSYFLAEVSLRQLFNRVSHVLSTHTSSPPGVTTLEPLVSDLDLQLSRWYDSLPEIVQFSISRIPTHSPMQTALRLRYFACRSLIYQSFILAVLADEAAALNPIVIEHCKKCLEACIRQIEHVTGP